MNPARPIPDSGLSASPSPTWWRYLLIVAAVGQLVSPTAIYLLGDDALTADRTDTPITPPGWTFLVWGLICLLSLAYALVQSPQRRSALDPAFNAVAKPLSLVFVLYSMWLAIAELDLVWATVPVFAAMLAGLLISHRAATSALRSEGWPATRYLLAALLGTYAGWASVAVFINLSAAIRQQGGDIDTTAGLVWQGSPLPGAVIVSAVIAYRWRAPVAYVATVLWALGGAAASTYQNGATPLTIVCVVGVAAFIAGVVVRRSGRNTSGPRRTIGLATNPS